MNFKKIKLLLLILFLISAVYVVYIITSKSAKISEVILEVGYFNDVSDTTSEHILHGVFGIKVDSMGYVYVLDRGNNRIVKFSPDGKFLTWFGGTGQGPGDLLNPIDFDIDKFGNIIVLEEGNHRISIFDRSGKWINSFSLDGNASSIFVTPQGEIFVNMPIIGGRLSNLFHIYNFRGEKLGEIGNVELIEQKPFNTYLVTQHLNYVKAKYNYKDKEIWAIYRARPLFKIYSIEGQLLVERIINTPETKSAIKVNKEYQEKHLSMKGWFGILYVFGDIDFVDDGVVVKVNNFSNVPYDYLYLLNRNGEVVKKYIIPLRVFNFAINRKENKIIIVSSDTLYQSKIK
uniref:6-bladed beta-propeller n=1 Tax=candidate division WOR-3 bacterium TaxID=2052148 RepID=A0A7V3ZTH8_UNCW3